MVKLEIFHEMLEPFIDLPTDQLHSLDHKRSRIIIHSLQDTENTLALVFVCFVHTCIIVFF